MRRCPQCGNEYEDSYRNCPKCEISLTDSTLSLHDRENFQDICTEINEIRDSLTKLNERLHILEQSLVHKEEKITSPKVTAAKEIRKAEKVQQRIIQPRKNIAENFEQILGGRWFNKLGILAIVIGVSLLTGYSLKYFGPVGKIGIGYIFSLGMLLFGNFIEKKKGFSIYGKTLIGGGWALGYFITYAMHNIPTVRLIESAFLGMFLLLGVSIATVIHIYRYRSEIATAFSYLLIYITLMITPISIYTMLSAVPVAVSLVFFMYKMRWLKFGLYGMALTYFTHLEWFGIVQKVEIATRSIRQLFVAESFLLLYWSIFVVATFLIKENSERRLSLNGISVSINFRDLTHIVNTIAASCLAWYLIWILRGIDFLKYLPPILAIETGLYLGLTTISYLFRQRSLCLISSTFSIIFMIVFLSIKYTGYSLTISYLILAELILLAGIILKERYWRLISFVLFLLIIELLIAVGFNVKNVTIFDRVSTRALLFSFAFVIYLINYILYSMSQNRNLLTPVEKIHTQIASYTYPFIYTIGTWLEVPKVLMAPCWIFLGVILLQLGISKNNYHQRLQGYILSVGAFIRLFMSNMLIQGGIWIFSYRILTCLPIILILYYCIIILQDKKTETTLKVNEKQMLFLYPYMIFAIIMFLVRYEVSKNLVAPIWGIIAMVYSLIGVRSKQHHLFSISSIAAFCASIRAIFINLLLGKYLVGVESDFIGSIFTAVSLYLGNIFYLRSKENLIWNKDTGCGKIKMFLRSSRLVFGLTATFLLTTLLMVKLNRVELTVSLGIEGLLLFLLGFRLGERYWRIFGLIVLLLTLGKAFLIDLRQLDTVYYILSLILLGLTLLFVSYIYTKHRDKIKQLI